MHVDLRLTAGKHRVHPHVEREWRLGGGALGDAPARGQMRSGSNPTLRSTYHHMCAAKRAGRRPEGARTDLARDFRVAVVSAGSCIGWRPYRRVGVVAEVVMSAPASVKSDLRTGVVSALFRWGARDVV
jgi:hypothetical protein